MRHAIYLALGAALLISAPVCAQSFYPGAPPMNAHSFYPGPAAELASGATNAAPIAPQNRAMAANISAPKTSTTGNSVPNGPLTSNPPGSGASSSDSLEEHGETGTNVLAPNRH